MRCMSTPTKHDKWSSFKGQLNSSKHILETYLTPKLSKHKLIPKQILQNAKAIILLTVHKIGFIMALNVGYGLLIIRNKQQTWSLPISIGMTALTCGSFKSKRYLLVINSETVVEQFIKNETLKLENVVPGPMETDTNVCMHPGDNIYSYPDNKLNGNTLTFKLSINEKFYNLKGITVNDILFEPDVVDMKYINNDSNYEKIVNVLDTYVVTETDKNIENNVNLLSRMYRDIDTDVIRAILVKQCLGNMKNAMDMISKISYHYILEEKDIEVKCNEYINDYAFSSGHLVEIAIEYLELSDDTDEADDFFASSSQSLSTI